MSNWKVNVRDTQKWSLILLFLELLLYLCIGDFQGPDNVDFRLSLTCDGDFGGSYLARTFSGKVGQVLIRPWVHKALNLASEGVQIPADGVVTGEGHLLRALSKSLIRSN